MIRCDFGAARDGALRGSFQARAQHSTNDDVVRRMFARVPTTPSRGIYTASVLHVYLSTAVVGFPTRVLWDHAVARLFAPAWIGCAGEKQGLDEGLRYGQPAGSVQDYSGQGGNAGEIDTYDTKYAGKIRERRKWYESTKEGGEDRV